MLPRRTSNIGDEIAPGVHFVGVRRHGLTNGGYSRIYLFEHGDDVTVVDTGWDEDAHMVFAYLASIGRSPADIKHIAITHAHRSHLGGLATLARASGAEVACHASEAPIVEGKLKAHPIKLWPPTPIQLIPFRIISWLPILNHVPCKVNRFLCEGDTVGPLAVLFTPGHTAGHLAFHDIERNALAVGDAVATWPGFGAGWPGFNRDNREYRRSLVRLVELAPAVVATGHGDAITADAAKRIRTLIRGRKFRGATRKA